jgi:hypothetical protein
MIQWRKIGDGLYQRFDDNVPQNLYIGRFGKKGHATAWQGMEKYDGKFEQTDWYYTLSEAKHALSFHTPSKECQ